MQVENKNLLLYAVTDRGAMSDGEFYKKIEAALVGGATMLQLREKHLSDEEFLKEAAEVKKICRKFNVPLIINDNAGVALQAGADGVHIGQDDADIATVRRILGDGKIIGVSAHSVEEALRAQKNGADYLGCGAVFGTASKSDAGAMALETLREICYTVDIPVVAIGGINEENIPLLAGSGICGAAVVSAIFFADDAKNAARRLRKAVENVVKTR